jgi:hypothetical protein
MIERRDEKQAKQLFNFQQKFRKVLSPMTFTIIAASICGAPARHSITTTPYNQFFNQLHNQTAVGPEDAKIIELP